jgi:IS30 family transposase
MEERTVIQTLLREKRSNRYIAKFLNRKPQTINNEVKRGLKKRIRRIKAKSGKIYKYIDYIYSAKKAQARYELSRLNCGRKHKWLTSTDFLEFVDDKILNDKWSPDAVVGFVKLHKLFPDDEILSTKTIYNLIDAGFLKTKNIDLNKKVARKTKKPRSRKNKKILGNLIEKRPDIVDSREEFGHWEIDTVVGIKDKSDAVLLTLTERKTRFEVIIKIDGKDASPVNAALTKIKEMSGKYFTRMFKTVTSDNGKEFSGLHELLKDTLDVYFTHPYSSWERGTNENHNGMIRRFIAKGQSISLVSSSTVQRVQTWMNNLPRKILGYYTPKEKFLDELRMLNLFV